MTASTFFRRSRTLAFRVVDSRHGTFLRCKFHKRCDASKGYIAYTNHKRPPLTAAVGLNAPNINLRVERCVQVKRGEGQHVNRFLSRGTEIPTTNVFQLTTMNGATTDIDGASSTPPPLNGVSVNGNGAANDSASAGTLKFTTGLILPPPDVKCTFPFILAFVTKLTKLRIYAHLHTHSHR